MSTLKKYKSFDEATRAMIDESIRNLPSQFTAEEGPETLSNVVGIPYKPGIYRFHSWQEAADYDLNQYIQQAVNKRIGC